MKKQKFYIIISTLVSLLMVSCSQSETVAPLIPEEIPSEALPASSYETPLDSVLTRSDRFLGQVFLETRSSSVNRQAEINTLYRPIGILTRNGEAEEIPVHIVNYTTGEDPAGYVILIGDERIDDAVVAYSNESNWVLGTIPAFEEMFLERLDNYIIAILSEGNPDEPIIGECQLEEWQEVGTFTKLLDLKTKWHQNDPYNTQLQKCEHYYSCGLRVPVGCVAVAMAQIMAYHKHPSGGSYYNDLVWGTVTTSYDWTAMTTDPRAENLSEIGRTMVAHLMAEVGKKVDMSYYCSECSKGSGSNIKRAVPGFHDMGYSKAAREETFSFQTIKNNLDLNRPLYMRGAKTEDNAGTHAWVVHGYQIIRTYSYSILTCESSTHQIEPEYSSWINDSYYLSFNLGSSTGIYNDGFYKATLYGMYPAFPYCYEIEFIRDIYPS